MGRSSEVPFLALMLAAGVAATSAQARGLAPLAPHPMMVRAAFTAPTARVSHPITPHALDRRDPGRATGRTPIAQARHPRRRFFGGGLGYDGYGSYDGFGSGAAPQAAEAGGNLPPPYVIPAPPAPCLPPQIIEIDGGLAHPPKTRVVYGMPACGAP